MSDQTPRPVSEPRVLHKVPKGSHALFVTIPKSEVHRNRDVRRGCLLRASSDAVIQTMRIFMNSVDGIRSSSAGDRKSSGG